MKNGNVREQIEVLFQQLLLGDDREFGGSATNHEYEYAFARAVEMLSAHNEDLETRRFHARLRLAMHLAPARALSYSSTNPTPRYVLIRDYLKTEFGRSPELAERLGRDISRVLQTWEEQRQSVTAYREHLLAQQGHRCGHCRVSFLGSVITLERRDEYKPYFLAPEELRSPEVDHIRAVSALGTNVHWNLQVLCRFCNGGKGDGLGLSVREELENAGVPIHKVHRAFRARIFYYVVLRDNRACTQCHGTASELTIRRVRANGAFARSNLCTLCVACAYG